MTLPAFFAHSLGQNAVIRALFFRSQIGPLNNHYFAFLSVVKLWEFCGYSLPNWVVNDSNQSCRNVAD